MAPIKIERIVSFNSEDPVHLANNLLSKDTSKKWKCKSSGEKSATVVFQLDQPYIISGIDIGNEHSAYIEVLVSRSSSPEDFKVLLVMSSFMTPLEARQSQNINKVRMFKQEDFSSPERDEKWDRIKVVCTQPFNRHVQYGLSFINLYSGDGKGLDKPVQQMIGKFIIRPDSPDDISIGSLFLKRKETQPNSSEQKLTGAAAIREATALAHMGSPANKQKIKHKLPAPLHSDDKVDNNTPKERNRKELLYTKDEEDVNEKIDKLVEKKAKEKELEEKNANEKVKVKKNVEKRKDTPTNKKTIDTGGASQKRKSLDQSKRKAKKPKLKTQGKPFEKLLENVVFVISGIQNPDRASLRSMALAMGAKYKADWDNSCTHLICAFANTPKFHQVKGKGKIVKRKWLDDCYNERKRLPWRRYALDKADEGPESEEEVCEKDDTPPSEVIEDVGRDSDTDIETREEGSDTEERIKNIQKNQQTKQKLNVYDMDTDTELHSDSYSDNLKIKHNKLKNLFEDKIFYVDEVFGEELEKKIKQYIVAYKGIVRDDLEVLIDIILTNKGNSKILKELYPKVTLVAPEWLWDCHNSQKLVPMDNYTFD